VAGGAALALLLVALVADLLWLPTGGQVAVERDLPPSVGLGDRVEGSYTIRNASARTLRVALRDRFPAIVAGGTGSGTATLAPRTVVTLPFTVEGRERGEAAPGPVGLRVTGTLGLAALRIVTDPADRIRVVPSLSGVRQFRLLAMQHRLTDVGVRVLRRKGDGQSFASLREYVRGDDPRHIDWKATSRRAKLITREFTVERSQTVLTLIDAGRGMTQRAGEWARFDHALRSALVLTDIAATAGDRVGTLVFDDEIRAFVPPLQRAGALSAVRDALVPVRPSSTEPDYAGAFRYLAAHVRKRALVVFYTDVIDTRASAALLAHVARGAARHLVLVVAMRTDALFDAARVPAEASPARAFDGAAAEEVIQARQGALERMRRAGVVVADVSPASMTAAVVNRYLELKSRGAL
jgi:uncharacterized protein (DUF58 family)